MLGGVITLLVEMGRELDQVLTHGSIERARSAALDADARDELRNALDAALDLSPLTETT